MRENYGPNRLSPRLALRPFIDAFEFRGRSTRTEVISFYLLGFVAGLPTVTWDIPPLPAFRFLSICWALVWGWPWFPLLVRRLHDQNRSAKWIIFPATGIAAFSVMWLAARAELGAGSSLTFNWGFYTEIRHIAWSPASIALGIIFMGSAFATFALFLWDDTDDSNGYGSDPRLAA